MQLLTVHKLSVLLKKDKERTVLEERCKPYEQDGKFFLPILLNESFTTLSQAYEVSAVLRNKLNSFIDFRYYYLLTDLELFNPSSYVIESR